MNFIIILHKVLRLRLEALLPSINQSIFFSKISSVNMSLSFSNKVLRINE